ncbi:MAG: hypothetical protein AAB925_01590 [Patescibacteria group bacterium]
MKKPINFSAQGLTASKEKIKKFFYFLAVHIFFIILILIFLDILFGGFLFYKYVILANRQEPDVQDNTFKFNESAYQSVVDKLEAKEKDFNNLSQENYLNPFQDNTPP